MSILMYFVLVLRLPNLSSLLAKIILHLLLVPVHMVVFVDVVIPHLIVGVVVLPLQLSLVLMAVVVIPFREKVLAVAVGLFTVHILEGTIILWTIVMIFMVSRGKILLLQYCSLIILLALIRKLLSLLHLL